MNWVKASEAKLNDGQAALLYDGLVYQTGVYSEHFDWFEVIGTYGESDRLERTYFEYIMIIEKPEVSE